MDHPDIELTFYDLSGLSLEDQNEIQMLLNPQNRKHVGVKFPWDDPYEDSKEDENGNSISQIKIQPGIQAPPIAFHVPPPGLTPTAGVIVQPGIVPVQGPPGVTDAIHMHNARLPAPVYPTPPFVSGYPTVTHHEMMLSQPPQAIQLGPPPASGMVQLNGSANDSFDVRTISNAPVASDMDQTLDAVSSQAVASNPHLPFSSIPQHFNTQSGAALFYSPTGPHGVPNRQPLIYMVPYPTHPSAAAYQSVHHASTIPSNHGVLSTEESTVDVISHQASSEADINEALHMESNNHSTNSSLTLADNDYKNDSGESSHDSGLVHENNEDLRTDEDYLSNKVNNVNVVRESDSDSQINCTRSINNDLVSGDDSVAANVTTNNQSDISSSVCNNVTKSAWTKPKSWASLFSDSASDDRSSTYANKNTHVFNVSAPEFNPREKQKVEDNLDEDTGCVSPADDFLCCKIGSKLLKFQIDQKSVHLWPRGLVNKSNWCYINATLQALLVCPPFYNLLKELPIVPGLRGRSSTPIMDNLVEFINNFKNCHLNINRNKRKDELSCGPQFEPNNIYRLLNGIRSSCVKGRQEDAEEFLSCILDGLHEEMVAVTKLTNTMRNGDVTANGNIGYKINGTSEDSDWLVIQGKNKGIITRHTTYATSPVTEIFGGKLRSVLKKSGADPSANLEPFFTLPLDVQSDQVSSIMDALHGLVSKESVEGCICAKTGVEVEASRRLTLEELPSILILHIKRFVYNKDGGCQKVLKQVQFPMDLELSPDLLSQEVRLRYKKFRSYKLFAVVYHDGKEAVKGHYITDAYHSGSNGWLRFDDSVVSRISEMQVLRHSPPRVPYLLFYKRSQPYVGIK